MIRRRSSLLAAALAVVGLSACNPGPGEAAVTVDSPAVTGETSGGTATCDDRGVGGETYIPTWRCDVGGKLTFAGLASPTVDTATFERDGVTWAAMNRPGLPPTIEPEVDDEGVLHVTASLTRLDGQPGELTVGATVRCP